MGFDCPLLEARARPGGRVFTVRRGTIREEDGPRQTAAFDQRLYFNAGPMRIFAQPLHDAELLAFPVSQQTRQIGIRMALGGRARDIQWSVLHEGLILVIAGIAIGTVISLASTRLLIGYLYGVSRTDVVAFVGGPAALTAIAIVATYVPARRAARTNPLEAIRCE